MLMEFLTSLNDEQEKQLRNFPEIALDDYDFLIITNEIENFSFEGDKIRPKDLALDALMNRGIEDAVYHKILWYGEEAIIGFKYH